MINPYVSSDYSRESRDKANKTSRLPKKKNCVSPLRKFFHSNGIKRPVSAYDVEKYD